MAGQRLPSLFILLASLFSFLSSALQVTPNSPCASFCIDSSDLDKSDPESSSTSGSDFVCSDEDFTRNTKGQKFQRCLSCLQDSTFQQGSENDQDWFLYNLRYSFDYCIFGYPNATDVGSNPCMTSEACGGIEKALKQDILEPTDREQYGYCGGSGKNVLSDVVERCRSCVKADRTHSYLSNFLVALEAGCQQQPAPGHIIGLNDTIFVKTTIQITNPSLSTAAASSGVRLPTAAIAGIAVGAVILLLVAAGCTFMQCRKRRNRKTRAMRAQHLRASSLSFRCQTHLDTPRGAHFNEEGLEKSDAAVDASLWNPKNAMSSLRTQQQLTNITTSLPSPAYFNSSPKIGSPDDYTTPTSALSARSDKPLLYQKPYMQSPATSSPLASPGLSMVWEEQRVAGQRELTKKGSWGVATPVETRFIQTKFPPPPKR